MSEPYSTMVPLNLIESLPKIESQLQSEPSLKEYRKS